jgi:soluble lytic murein transglycosylase-like protein
VNILDLIAPYRSIFEQAGQRFGLDPMTLEAIAATETGGTFRPNLTSPAGARGLMQLMPATARGVGVSNPFDPAQSIFGGANVLAQDLAQSERRLGGQGWNALRQALMAYNNGPNPARWNNPQTQAYPNVFLRYYDQIRQAMAPQADPNGGAQGGLLAMQAPGVSGSGGGTLPPTSGGGLLAMLQGPNDTGSA